MTGNTTKLTCLADIEAFEEIPWRDRLTATNTFDLILQAAEEFADRPALKFLLEGDVDEKPVVVSYKELGEQVTRAANLFHSRGVSRDDVVSYILPNLTETHYTIWGGQAAGIVNAINPFLEPETILELLRAAGTKVLVTLAPMPGWSEIWDKVAPIIDAVGTIQTVFQVVPRPVWKGAGAAGGATDGGIPILDFNTAMAEQTADRLVSGRVIVESDIAAYFHTGGTTGTPKLARHSHLNEAFMPMVTALNIQMDEESVMFCGLPLFHVNAVMVTGVNAFYRGSCVVLLTPLGYRSPKVIANFWRLVEKFRATTFSGVPTLFAKLLGVPTGGADLSSLKYAVCGAAPMPRELIRRFQRVTGVGILEGYGLTEGTCVSSCNPLDGERRVGSIGYRIAYQEMKAVMLDDKGAYLGDCGEDEVGVIAIRGPNIFAGYLQEEANIGLFLDDGWMLTGDLGRCDKDGYFWLTGRAKDVIIRGGHNIDPGLIEEVLALHPAVELAAAVGQLDAYAGELPVAFVALSAGASVESGELEDLARKNITERAAVPVRVEILDQMPVTSVGKIFKPALRCSAAVHALTKALTDAGITVELEVFDDKQRGMVARVTSDADEAAIGKVLSDFAICWEKA